MLDAFLEVACGHIKQAEAQKRMETLIEKLPPKLVEKLAYGGNLACGGGGPEGSWLEQFQGTPLYDQALAIEKEDLQSQMEEAEMRRARVEFDASAPRWEESDLKRQELSIKRKMLELELAGADVGGQEGEDVGGEESPVDMEAVEAEGMPQTPKATSPEQAAAQAAEETVQVPPPSPQEAALAQMGAEKTAPPQEEEEAPPEEEEEPPPMAANGEEKAESKPKEKSDKPKTKITTVEKESEPKEKIDIKAAAVKMRFKLAAARLVKEAQPAGGQAPFLKK